MPESEWSPLTGIYSHNKELHMLFTLKQCFKGFSKAVLTYISYIHLQPQSFAPFLTTAVSLRQVSLASISQEVELWGFSTAHQPLRGISLLEIYILKINIILTWRFTCIIKIINPLSWHVLLNFCIDMFCVVSRSQYFLEENIVGKWVQGKEKNEIVCGQSFSDDVDLNFNSL